MLFCPNLSFISPPGEFILKSINNAKYLKMWEGN
jgi:hypothetical protein